jgi:GT2 family glycosyltransferase
MSVVIITRNEEAHIAGCLEAILAATADLDGCELVLVDSRSDDRTLDVARAYPVRVIELSGTPRCCPALGRYVGGRVTKGRYVHFVDGDTSIVPGWLRAATDVLESDSSLAAVGGREDQVYYRDGTPIGTKSDYFGTGDTPSEVKQLGGNGLYRRAALEGVGSFNPYVRSFEEAELGARLRQAGWRLLRVPQLMGYHHTPKPDALDEYWRRLRSHLLTGQGQVLRLSIRHGLFLEHLRQLNRLVLFLVWLSIGAISGFASMTLGSGRPLVAWAIASAVLLAAFAVRSRSITKPLRLIFDWAVCSPPFVWGFLLPTADPRALALNDAIAADDRSGETLGGRTLPRATRSNDASASLRVRSQGAVDVG